MTYARYASSSTRPWTLRLLLLLPVIILLPFLPWRLRSIHLRVISAFFLVWLGVFKLLLLSFGPGPTLPFPPPPHLPRRVRCILLSAVVSTYKYEAILFYRYLLVSTYCIHMYLALELVLACAALFVCVVLGLHLEPQFDAPYRSSSLTDFWGRRWNLTVTGILRPSVYTPVSARWGPAAGAMVAFLVSGLMHEVVFWYITAAGPTGEVTCFFFLHGACVAAEGSWRRKGWQRSPGPAVSVPATVGFVAVTGYWLFFPQLLKEGADQVVLVEAEAAVRFLEDAGRAVLSRVVFS